MRRAVVAIVGTAVGTTVLVGLKAGLATGGQPARTAASAPLYPAASGSTPPAGGTGLHQGVFTGSVARTDYGPVQVRITVTGGRITDATALQLPNDTAMSVELSRRAGPALRQETFAAQSARIDTVSGASYTSQGYRVSLQSALDAAKRG